MAYSSQATQNSHKTYALITGASTGIGKVFAEELAKNGWNLILVARREELLIEVSNSISNSKIDVQVMVCDLREPDQRSNLIQKIENQGLEIELLVNNAGFGYVGDFARGDLKFQLEMIEVNCSAPLHLSHHFLPKMRKAKKGGIINVCSTASFQPLPYMATYAGTKALLFSLSTALATEAKEDGVTVLACCPGPTESDFHLVSGLPKKMSYLPAMTAQSVVQMTLRSLAGKKQYVVTGIVNRCSAFLSKHLPTFVSTQIVKNILYKHR